MSKHFLNRIFENNSTTLGIYCDKQSYGFLIFAEHSQHGRGATDFQIEETKARKSFKALCHAAKALGWQDQILRCESRGFIGGTSNMRIENGKRIFRNIWTGERTIDNSCWEPLSSSEKPHKAFFGFKFFPVPRKR